MVSKLRHVIVILMTTIALMMMLSVLFSGNMIHANMTMNNQFTAYSLLKYLFLGMALLVIAALVTRLSHHHDKLVKRVLWAIIIGIVIFAILVQPYAPVYDSMGVNVQVYDLVNPFPHGKWSNYFSIFPNNVPITTFLFWIDMPFRHFLTGLEDFLLLNAVYGQLLMLFSIYHMSKLADKMFGSPTRNVLLLFYVFVPTYLMQLTQIGYSDTVSLPFLVIGIRYVIELFYNLKNDNTQLLTWRRLGINDFKAIVLSSVCFAIALFLRPNTIVALLAIAVIIGVFFWRQWQLIIMILVALSLSHVVVKEAGSMTTNMTNYQVSHDKNLQMPIESWFLTAYYLDGRSGNEINAITDKYKKYDQRKAYIRSKLLGKFKDLGPIGILTTWRDKTNVLFGIKSDFGMQYFNQFRNHGDHTLQEQYQSNYKFLAPKMIHSTMTVTLLSILSFGILPFYFFAKNKTTDLNNDRADFKNNSFSILMILGVFESLSLFYILLWEVQEHYIYMMFPFLLLLGASLWRWAIHQFRSIVTYYK